VLAREPLGIDDCALYPLFDDELLALMRRVISPDKKHAVGVAVIFRARRGSAGRDLSKGPSSTSTLARIRAGEPHRGESVLG
jgi:hypothetical protein